MAKTYLCKNSACILGDPSQPGRFSGGISAEQVTLLTGKPVDDLVKGEDYGDGICPNCGQKGEVE